MRGTSGKARSPYTALHAWRWKLAARKRTPATFDALWRAPCAELASLKFEAAGLPDWLRPRRRDAQRIVRAAAWGRVA